MPSMLPLPYRVKAIVDMKMEVYPSKPDSSGLISHID